MAMRKKFLERRLKIEKIKNAFSVEFFPKLENISFGQGNQIFSIFFDNFRKNLAGGGPGTHSFFRCRP